MNIQIPQKLQEISKQTKTVGDTLTINCGCCGDDFLLFINDKIEFSVSRYNQKKIDETNKWRLEVFDKVYDKVRLPKSFSEEIADDYRDIKIFKEYDPKLNKAGTLVKSWRIEKGAIPLSDSEIQELHPTDDTLVIRAKCATCGKEHVLFDNRVDGMDAYELPQQLNECTFRQRRINKILAPVRVRIIIKNPWNFKDLSKNNNPDLTANDFAEMFSHIRVEAISKDGAVTIICDEECG